MSTSILTEKTGKITKITINRQEVRNAVDKDTMLALRDAVEQTADDGTRVVIITGAGGHFCSGADIKAAMASNLTPDDAIGVLTESYGPALKSIRNCPWPVIAAIEGNAAGIGLDLAMACDIRVASGDAILSELFIKVGLIPDGGGTFMLQRLVGIGRAMHLTFTGEPVPAEKALSWGLITSIFPSATFSEDLMKYAGMISKQSPVALHYGKKAIHEALYGNYEDALNREAEYQKKIFSSKYGFEGFKAFVEKRPPSWLKED